MKSKSVRIELTNQSDSTKSVSIETEIESENIQEVANTTAARILSLYKKAKKFKQSIGFTFARKFDVKLVIDGYEVNGTQTILGGAMEFSITVQNSENSVNKFVEFINELTFDCLTQSSREVIDEIDISQFVN